MTQATTDVKRLAREWVDVWNNGDYEKISDIVAEFNEFLRNLRAGFPDFTLTIDEMVASGNTVMIEWSITDLSAMRELTTDRENGGGGTNGVD